MESRDSQTEFLIDCSYAIRAKHIGIGRCLWPWWSTMDMLGPVPYIKQYTEVLWWLKTGGDSRQVVNEWNCMVKFHCHYSEYTNNNIETLSNHHNIIAIQPPATITFWTIYLGYNLSWVTMNLSWVTMNLYWVTMNLSWVTTCLESPWTCLESPWTCLESPPVLSHHEPVLSHHLSWVTTCLESPPVLSHHEPVLRAPASDAPLLLSPPPPC